MKNKKNLSIFAMCVILILGLSSLVYGGVADSAKIKVTLISQEPDPAAPGEMMDIRFKVENYGGGGTENLFFEILPEYPFSMYTGEQLKELGSMQAYQTGEEGVIVHYKLRIDENAIEGENYIDVRFKAGEMTKQWQNVRDFPIRIRTRDLVVSVEDITSTPEMISPGDEFELSLTLKNNADSSIKDIIVNLDLSEDDTPFAPSSSTSEKQVYQINSKTGKIINFDLIALPDAEGGIYKIPINISYTDATGQSYSKDDIISLKISSTPDLLVNIESSEIGEKQRSGNVVIKIVNRGLTNIKLLSAKMLPSEKLEILSKPEVYVGNIDSDDYETAEFELSLDSYEKSIQIPLELNYKDSTNKEYIQKINLEFNTQSKGYITTVISSIISVLINIGIIVGIILGVRWFFKRRKAKRKG